MKKIKNKRGFTLIEMLIVVAIIAVLVAVSIPTFSGALANAKLTTCSSNISSAEHMFSYECIMDNSRTNEEILNIVKESVFGSVDGIGCTEDGASYIYSFYDINGNPLGSNDTNGIRLKIKCSVHGNENTKSEEQYSSFINYLNQWLTENDFSAKGAKGEFYAEYYKDHQAVKMEDKYKQNLIDAGLNKTIKADLYWWTYPITDNAGKVIYTVTYANTIDDTDAWCNTQRGKIGMGYVVNVNGKTYIRSNSGKTIEPGNQNQLYKTEDALEQALIDNSYILVN